MRNLLFFLSLVETMMLGVQLLSYIIRLSMTFVLAFLVNSLTQGLTEKAKDGSETVDPTEEVLVKETTVFGLSMGKFGLLLLANLCLIYATKDETETGIKKKLRLLSGWLWILILKLSFDFTIFYWNLDYSAKDPNSVPDWETVSYSDILGRFGFMLLGIIYELQLRRSMLQRSKTILRV